MGCPLSFEGCEALVLCAGPARSIEVDVTSNLST
jgi:hypothetical protein